MAVLHVTVCHGVQKRTLCLAFACQMAEVCRAQKVGWGWCVLRVRVYGSERVHTVQVCVLWARVCPKCGRSPEGAVRLPGGSCFWGGGIGLGNGTFTFLCNILFFLKSPEAIIIFNNRLFWGVDS